MADWTSPDGEVHLTNVHRETGRCVVGNCVIHHPDLTARMNVEEWGYTWIGGGMWRTCKCGQAYLHPDVDDARWRLANMPLEDSKLFLSHMCCGCCGSEFGFKTFDEMSAKLGDKAWLVNP